MREAWQEAGAGIWERGDQPATNVLEGRVLRELRVLQRAFTAARGEGLAVPVLRVLPKLQGVLGQGKRPKVDPQSPGDAPQERRAGRQ